VHYHLVIMHPHVILVPYDSGQHRSRMGLGPERIFEAGLKPLFSRMGMDFDCEEIALEAQFPAEIATAFLSCRKISQRVSECRERGHFPIVLSGNCNTAVGTLSGCGARDTGIVWFDAHGEATTPETTTSGFLDGMGIGILGGRSWRRMAESIPGFVPVSGRRIALFGARDIEPAEQDLLNGMGVAQLTQPEQLGAWLSAPRDFEQVYLHVDLDVLDSSVAIANQWAPAGGITVECLRDAILETRKHARIAALGIASYDPEADRDGRALAAAVTVVEAAMTAETSNVP
jgi:arginase